MTQFPPPSAVEPPTMLEYAPLPRQPVWPKVIGIISIAYASLGIVCTPVGLAINAMNPASKEAMEEMFPDWWESYTIFGAFLGVAMAILLLVGGIILLRRRAAGRTLHLVYGVISVIWCIVGTMITIAWTSDGSVPPPMRVGMMVGLVFGVFFGLAYPVFLLIWFSRANIRNEVALWSQAPAQWPAE